MGQGRWLSGKGYATRTNKCVFKNRKRPKKICRCRVKEKIFNITGLGKFSLGNWRNCQWSRALASLSKDLGSIPRTHMLVQYCLQLQFPRTNTVSGLPQRSPVTHWVRRNTLQAKHLYLQNNIKIKIMIKSKMRYHYAYFRKA